MLCYDLEQPTTQREETSSNLKFTLDGQEPDITCQAYEVGAMQIEPESMLVS